MTLPAVANPFAPFVGLEGAGLNGGALYIGAVGSDPQSVPQACYWDAAGTIPATQPIDILGGYPMRLGSPARLYTLPTYSMRVRDAQGVQVFYVATASNVLPAVEVLASLGVFPDRATAAAATIPTTLRTVGLTIMGYYASGDSPATQWRYSASEPSHPGKFQSADGAWWELVTKNPIPEMFGAVGNGVADDTTAMSNFLLYVPGKTGFLPGVYKITSSLTFAAINCKLYGTPGASKIIRANGYVLIIFDAFSHTDISGINFEVSYANAVFVDTGILYTNFGVTIRESSIRNCYFTAPSANTRALMFYAHTGADPGIIDGLWVEDNTFFNFGGLGITVMNRSGVSSNAQRVYINRNKFQNMGLIDTNGFALSLDGTGQSFTVNHNQLENCKVLGLENTGWNDGEWVGNRFTDFSRTWAPMQFSNTACYRNVIRDNICEEAATALTQFMLINDSTFSGNIWTHNAGSCFVLGEGSDNKFRGDTFIGVGGAPLVVDDGSGAATGNTFDGCTSDSRGAAGSATVRFSGSGTTLNTVRNLVALFDSGVVADETSSAAGNLVDGYSTGTVLDAQLAGAFTFGSDANVTISGAGALIAYGMLRVEGALTATRDLTLNKTMFAGRSKIFINNTAQSIRLNGGGGIGSTIVSGADAVVYWRDDTDTFVAV